jgi:hypothetical protein
MRDGMAKHSADLGFGKTEIFLQTGLDRKKSPDVADLPVGQISGSDAVDLIAKTQTQPLPSAARL